MCRLSVLTANSGDFVELLGVLQWARVKMKKMSQLSLWIIALIQNVLFLWLPSLHPGFTNQDHTCYPDCPAASLCHTEPKRTHRNNMCSEPGQVTRLFVSSAPPAHLGGSNCSAFRGMLLLWRTRGFGLWTLNWLPANGSHYFKQPSSHHSPALISRLGQVLSRAS